MITVNEFYPCNFEMCLSKRKTGPIQNYLGTEEDLKIDFEKCTERTKWVKFKNWRNDSSEMFKKIMKGS